MPFASDALLLPSEQDALRQFVDKIKGHFKERIQNILLFGSRARKSGHEDSDIDVFVEVVGLEYSESRFISDQAADLLTSHDVIIAPLSLSKTQADELRLQNKAIIRNIEREGVDLSEKCGLPRDQSSAHLEGR